MNLAQLKTQLDTVRELVDLQNQLEDCIEQQKRPVTKAICLYVEYHLRGEWCTCEDGHLDIMTRIVINPENGQPSIYAERHCSCGADNEGVYVPVGYIAAP